MLEFSKCQIIIIKLFSITFFRLFLPTIENQNANTSHFPFYNWEIGNFENKNREEKNRKMNNENRKHVID